MCYVCCFFVVGCSLCVAWFVLVDVGCVLRAVCCVVWCPLRVLSVFERCLCFVVCCVLPVEC